MGVDKGMYIAENLIICFLIGVLTEFILRDNASNLERTMKDASVCNNYGCFTVGGS